MKKIFLLLFMALSFAGMSQSNYIVVKESGSDKENLSKESTSNPKLGADELYAEYETDSTLTGCIVRLTAYNNLRSSRLKYDGFKVSYQL